MKENTAILLTLLFLIAVATLAASFWSARRYDKQAARSNALQEKAAEQQSEQQKLLDAAQAHIQRSNALVDRQEKVLSRVETMLEKLENRFGA